MGWPEITSKERAAAAEAKGIIILEEGNSNPGRRAQGWEITLRVVFALGTLELSE